MNTIAQIIHFVYILTATSYSYPLVICIERTPELILVVLIVTFTLLYYIGQIASNWQLKQPIFFEIDTPMSTNFRAYLRKFAEVALTNQSAGFSKEMEPIIAPIGIGMPPSLLTQPHRNPFNIKIQNMPSRKWYDVGLAAELWVAIISAPFNLIFKPMLKLLKNRFINMKIPKSVMMMIPNTFHQTKKMSILTLIMIPMHRMKTCIKNCFTWLRILKCRWQLITPYQSYFCSSRHRERGYLISIQLLKRQILTPKKVHGEFALSVRWNRGILF